MTMMIVEQLVESELAGETAVLGENLRASATSSITIPTERSMGSRRLTA
jgi:hypothetical protein